MRIDRTLVPVRSHAWNCPMKDMEAGAAESGDVKRMARGALFVVAGQLVNFAVRMGSMAILARILLKSEFGLVGMVMAFTGFLTLFRDIGLSTASVQRAQITNEQSSTLFWINLAFGGVLLVVCGAAAPMLVAFFREPRLFWITVTMGLGFVFNGAAVQHRALLQRSMRFGMIVTIEIAALILSSGAGIVGALTGLGYWSLVISAVGFPAFAAMGFWIGTPLASRTATAWRRRALHAGLRRKGHAQRRDRLCRVQRGQDARRTLLRRGCAGRLWKSVPTGQPPDREPRPYGGTGRVPGPRRVQDDPVRLRSYFLRGYELFLSIIVPVTVWCALLAHDIIVTLLGDRWTDAISVFQWLTPTILAFAIINPFSWLMLAGGHADRSLKIAFLIAPVIIAGYSAGLPYGIEGVAIGFSIAMTVLVIPIVVWAKRGTLITNSDVLKVMVRPALSVLCAVLVTMVLEPLWQRLGLSAVRLLVASGILFGVYFAILLFGMGQKERFLGALRGTPQEPAMH
jgi:PST family polysaccharide transporter